MAAGIPCCFSTYEVHILQPVIISGLGTRLMRRRERDGEREREREGMRGNQREREGEKGEKRQLSIQDFVFFFPGL